MSISIKFDTSTNASPTNGRIAQSIGDNFISNYDYVGTKGLFTRYPDKEFRVQGIPTPRQIIAWRTLIKIMGEEEFSKLLFHLNYLEDRDILFKNKFSELIAASKNPGNIEVTFSCGYFWRFTEERRYEMVGFVIKEMLEKNITVKIWTQDETLKRDFRERMGDSDKFKFLHIRRISHRIDIHYTLVEFKNEDERNNSCLFLELPHTESHEFRLETFTTFAEIKSFKCSEKKIMGFLEKQRRILTPVKSILSRCFNRALNTG